MHSVHISMDYQYCVFASPPAPDNHLNWFASDMPLMFWPRICLYFLPLIPAEEARKLLSKVSCIGIPMYINFTAFKHGRLWHILGNRIYAKSSLSNVTKQKVFYINDTCNVHFLPHKWQSWRNIGTSKGWNNTSSNLGCPGQRSSLRIRKKFS